MQKIKLSDKIRTTRDDLILAVKVLTETKYRQMVAVARANSPQELEQTSKKNSC